MNEPDPTKLTDDNLRRVARRKLVNLGEDARVELDAECVEADEGVWVKAEVWVGFSEVLGYDNNDDPAYHRELRP
jgi:hypothetical protein